MAFRRIAFSTLAVAASLWSAAASAACGITIDTSTLGGFVTYGDGKSYSLPVAGFVQTGDSSTYKVAISDANDCLFVAVDENGGWITPTGTEKPYATPTGADDVSYFSTDPFSNRGVNGVGSINTLVSNAWDSSLSALKTYLTSGGLTYDPIFLFQNNQKNSQQCLPQGFDTSLVGNSFCQSLAGWARIWITDENGNTLKDGTGKDYNFLFTNDGKPYKQFIEGGGGVPFGDPLAYYSADTAPQAPANAGSTDFVLSGGDICVFTNGNPALTFTAACNTSPPPGYTKTLIPHNLGNNEFPYAIQFPELNALLANLYATKSAATLGQYTFHMDLRLGCGQPMSNGNPSRPAVPLYQNQGDPCLTAGEWGNGLNNGGESLVIAYGVPSRVIPEPSVIVLMSLGLLALFFGSAIRRNARVLAH